MTILAHAPRAATTAAPDPAPDQRRHPVSAPDPALAGHQPGSPDYRRIVAESQIVVDTRNATKGIAAANIVHC